MSTLGEEPRPSPRARGMRGTARIHALSFVVETMTSFLNTFTDLLLTWRPAFKQERTFIRVARVLMGLLATQGRSTITNSIMLRGKEQDDWSADYKAFNRSEWSVRDLFSQVLLEGVNQIGPEGPVVLAMDDTCLPKVGQKIPQARYCHDPLRPKFLPMPIQWGIRMLHAAVVIPDEVNHRPLLVSTAFDPIPAEPKPPKGRVMTEAEEVAFEARKRSATLTFRAVDLICHTRTVLDKGGHKLRRLRLVVDGSFTNGQVINHLPPGTDLIGRTRKDAKFFHPLIVKDGKRIYGEAFDIPEKMMDDPSVPLEIASIRFGGEVRDVKFKEVPRLLWRGSKGRVMRLLIVMPVPYSIVGRRKKGYNNPAYLLTTDLVTAGAELIQSYMDRWGIEVLHRNLKTYQGVGQVQVFSKAANEKIHGAHVAAFSMLNLAAQAIHGGKHTVAYPALPLWRRKQPMRISSQSLASMLRNELLKQKFFEPDHQWKPEGWVMPHRETYQAA